MMHSEHDANTRTPSSGVLVQLLFVFGALGTGVVAGLASWLAPKREEKAPPERKNDEE